MADRDVPGDDMTTHEFSDDDAEAIISGSAAGEPELGAALDDLRSAFAAIEPPTAAGALTEFIVRGADPAPVTAGAAAVPLIEPLVETTPTRRHPVLASLSAFAGTALGKICIGASFAAASVGGATAVGVDTPISPIFEDDSAVVTEDTDPDAELSEVDDAADEVEVGDDDDADETYDDADAHDDGDHDADETDDPDGSDDDADDGEDSDDDGDDGDDADDSEDLAGIVDFEAIDAVFKRIDARWNAFLAIDDPTSEEIDRFFADIEALHAELVALTSDVDLDDILDGTPYEDLDLDDLDLDDLDLDDLPSHDTADDSDLDNSDLLDDVKQDVEDQLDDVDDLLDDVDDLLEDVERELDDIGTDIDD